MRFLLFLVWFLFHFTYGVAAKDDQAPLMIVSLDGMAWRVLKGQIANTANLNFIAQTGAKAEFIKNVMPSKTWPNHHSILTGLYAESHGIVANIFWDHFTLDRPT